MSLKNSGDSTGFEPITSRMQVQCSNQLSYEVTQLRVGRFVGHMFSRERNSSNSLPVIDSCPVRSQGERNQINKANFIVL